MENQAQRDIYCFQEEAPHAALIIPPIGFCLINY